jgi:hypothetical protein
MSSPVPWGDRLALIVVALLLLASLIVLLAWLPSLWDAIQEGPVLGSYSLSTRPDSMTPRQTAVQIQVAQVDEVRGVVTLRVSAHRGCEAGCAELERISLFGLQPGYPKTRGVPESATVALQPGEADVRQTIEFPLSGQAILYPFDVHELWLALRLEGTDAAGAVQPQTLAQAEGNLIAAVRADVPRFQMAAPVPVDAASIVADPQQMAPDQPQDGYLSIHVLRLQRSRWLQIMAVMLVLLITMASGYAAFMRSVPDLVMGAGGLVLGVWGIRSMLVPGSISYATVVDMALGLVITFLLTTLSIRMLLYLCERNDIRLGRRPPEAPAPPAGGTRVVDDLDRLTALKKDGALTEEEFQGAKRKLLS